jgi:hypothetical protein
MVVVIVFATKPLVSSFNDILITLAGSILAIYTSFSKRFLSLTISKKTIPKKAWYCLEVCLLFKPKKMAYPKKNRPSISLSKLTLITRIKTFSNSNGELP